MQVDIRSLDQIAPYERNPRKQHEAAIAKLAKSIQKFGWRQPIVVDADGVIIVGHRRYWAAQSLGLTEAPVHVAADLTTEQCKEYRLADNKLSEDGEWDETLLVAELLDLSDLGVDTTELGFAAFEDKSEQLAPTDELAAEDPLAEAVSEKRLTGRDHMVNAVFYMADIAALEAAITKTGEKNRAKALAAICHAYVGEALPALPEFSLDGLYS